MARPTSRGQTPKPVEKLVEKHVERPVEKQPVIAERQTTKSSSKANKNKSYKSDGVEDNDVFLLPVSDYHILTLLTLLSSIVRLFRISQPTSVVFDEVQYVAPSPSPNPSPSTHTLSLILRHR